jgi:hypothetical protein
MARKRTVLTPSVAREIESLAPSFADIMRRGAKKQLSIEIAERFGVHPKTIRDIWNRKSWKGFNQQTQSTELQHMADSFLEIMEEEDWDTSSLL